MLSDFVRDWISQYPIDYWWRKKYSIAFGSQAHREANFIDMKIDFLEERAISKLEEDYLNKLKLEQQYQKNGILNPQEGLSKKDDDLFNDLEI